MALKLLAVTIIRFRSITKLRIKFKEAQPLIICGANNVGKTNFLRALDLFFSLDPIKFDAKNDIPYDIEAGTRGARYNTRIIGEFIDSDSNKFKIDATFEKKKDAGNIVTIRAKKNRSKISKQDAEKVIKSFRFLFIEASNINIPNIIAEVIDEEVMPLGLNPQRRKQTESLTKLNSFISSSKKSVKKIEREIERILNAFINNIPGIDSKDWKVEILFAEYKKLYEALTNLIDFTLYDKNKKKMESKGSGIQRIMLLSLMKYIADRTKRNVIWGIDEPEAFLQPALQKRTFDILKEIAHKQSIFFTTHSQHFVDISDVSNTYLFEAEYETKEYVRRKGEIFYRVKTRLDESQESFERVQKIKEHLGIASGDSWEVMPYNLLVEGEEDKEYLNALIDKFNIRRPHILVAGGTSKIKGYLQFLATFCESLRFKPKIKCIVDHDTDGKDIFRKLENTTGRYPKFDLTVEYIPRVDGLKTAVYDNEIEDLIYPEIIREATNNFLKKQGYKVIKKAQLSERFMDAYDKKCMLNFLTEKTKTNNPAKEPIDFEVSNGGYKKIICEKVCRIIRNTSMSEMDERYPEVKGYVTRICNSP